MTAVMTVKQIRKVYGGKNEPQFEALHNISFEVEAGEFVGIMGASGSGKTTLLNILSTLDQPTAGEVVINQQNLAALKGDALADFRAREIGFIFQDFNLLENLTAYDNIALPLSLQNIATKKIKPAVTKIAAILGITQILSHYPAEISGGQKQRVAAARALVQAPSILMGDEPTGALDSKSAKDLLATMVQLNEQQQVAILLVTHDPFSASYCQRILFIKDGRIGTELKRGEQTKSEFYQQILQVLGQTEQEGA